MYSTSFCQAVLKTPLYAKTKKTARYPIHTYIDQIAGTCTAVHGGGKWFRHFDFAQMAVCLWRILEPRQSRRQAASGLSARAPKKDVFGRKQNSGT